MEKDIQVGNLTSSLKANKAAVLTVIISIILVDIFFLSINSDLIIFGILALYVLGVKFYKIKSRSTFLFCILLLLLMFILFLFSGPSFQTEKVAVWLYFFLAVGVFQQWKESD